MLARLDAISKDMLDVDSMRVVDVLERLPTKIPGKWVFCCYLTDSPARDLYDSREDKECCKGEGKRPTPSKMKGVGKDRKRLRALAKTGGVGSSGSSNSNLGGFMKSKIQMRKGVEIKLSDAELGVVEAADPGLIMRVLNECLSHGVVLGRRAWDEEKNKLEAEVKRLKGSVMRVEKKLKAKQIELDKTDFLYKEVSVTDCRFNVNLDVYNNRILDIAEISHLKAEQEAVMVRNEETVVTTPPANVDGMVSKGEDGEEEAEDAEEVAKEVNDEVADE
ncbi:hypothetical protein DEO72_LG9g1738 [Vigna unguiculata]|uniref:Uncharacterized protein n=1 Tax=Vigna unguiculata TaxID=3917 RepID=A0A4D6N1H6_VIGUN|nr:hypothetical protein DEO72_LG9g1738 [Vigna unguiculata]